MRDDLHPVEDANLISSCMFSWLTTFIWKMRKNGPTLDDLWETPHSDACEFNCDRFMEIWKKEQRMRGKNASLRRACFIFIRKSVIISIIAAVMTAIFEFSSQAIVLSLLMDYMTSSGDQHAYGLMLVCILLALELLRFITNSVVVYVNYRTGIRLRAGSVLAVFKKIMRNQPIKSISVGEVVNFCSNDGDRLFEFCRLASWVVCGPTTFVCGLIYLGTFHGWVAAVSCLLYPLVFLTMAVVAKKLSDIRREVIIHVDNRIQLISEMITSIKLIKMYSWEKPIKDVVVSIRNLELKCYFMSSCLQGIIYIVVTSSPMFLTTVIVSIYIIIGKPLNASNGITILAAINVIGYSLKLTPVALRAIAEGIKSMDRLQQVLTQQDFQDYIECIADGDYSIKLQDASFDWSTSCSVLCNDVTYVNDQMITTNQCCLENINLEIKKGTVVGISGNVGSGKSSLFYAILGQIFLKSGHVKVQGTTGYCSQVAWILNATIRDNILFGAEYDERKYKNIVEACCLLPDLSIFNSGDLTEVGERGINLSGGQKQRISLARAVYRDSDIYLLDDPLSAVDSHVGKSLFENVIMKLLRGKTVLLITHQLQYLPKCEFSIYMENGSIVELGSHKKLLKRMGEYNKLYTSFHETKHMQQPTKMDEGDEVEIEEQQALDVAICKIIEEESTTQSSSSFRSYIRFASSGGYFAFGCCVIAILIYTLSMELNKVLLALYLSRKQNPLNAKLFPSSNFTNVNLLPLSEYGFVALYWLSVVAIILFGVLQIFTFTWFSNAASKQLHSKLLNRVTVGTMNFFETIPTGRILNRFQKDQDIIDTQISQRNSLTVFVSSFILIDIIIISCIFPYVLLAILASCPFLFMMFRTVAVSIRQTRRLDNLTRSPWISHIVTSCSGISTLKSYKKTDEFVDQFMDLLDINTSPYYLLNCMMSWMYCRIELFAIFLSTCCGLLLILSPGISPAIRGLAMALALPTFAVTKFLAYDILLLESLLVAVDRIGEYIDIPSEKEVGNPPETVNNNKWPVYGRLEFKNVHMKYRENLPLALKGVSFSVDAKQRIGIVGRTGAGKSSLAVCLFRLVEICGGEILIDDVDISKIKLAKLRSALNSIPQDPTLFHGSIRYNLDPFNLYSDEQIWNVLENVHLKQKIMILPGKLKSMSDDVTGFSMGEKQLICLARAILRKNKIVILDEATASTDRLLQTINVETINVETDRLLQQSMISHFPDSTLLIIAHRLHTVLDCDKVLVMDDGLAVEFGSPQKLMEDKKSRFNELCRSSNW